MASTVELVFEAEACSMDALQRAAYRFCDRLAVDLSRDGTQFRCVLHPIDAAVVDATIVSSFRVEVLDQILRERLRNETHGVRNVILALAFSHVQVGDDAR